MLKMRWISTARCNVSALSWQAQAPLVPNLLPQSIIIPPYLSHHSHVHHQSRPCPCNLHHQFQPHLCDLPHLCLCPKISMSQREPGGLMGCMLSTWPKGFISLIKEGRVSLKLACSLSLVVRYLSQHTVINVATGGRSRKGNVMSSKLLAAFQLVYGPKFLRPRSRFNFPFRLLYKVVLYHFVIS
jgi:hypothetical protein